MKKEDVIKLVNAGFTKDDISKMFNEQTNETKPEVNQEKNDPEDFETKLMQSKTFTDLAGSIADLTKAVKASNILNSRQPEKEEQTVDDILASVFNPKPE